MEDGRAGGAPKPPNTSCQSSALSLDYAPAASSVRMQSAGRTVQRSAWRCRWSIQGHTPQFPRQPSRSSRILSLERAVSILATSAAYDLRDSQSKVVLPMFWHYRAVALESDTHGEKIFRWPDQVDGRRYRMLVLILDDERLEQAYADESEFNCLPAQARAALNTDELPLLVRLQYMNECHALNTAAAMALSRHASRHGLRFTVSSDKTDRVCCVDSIGWAWGAAPNGVQLAVTQARTERVRFQAHGHQYVTFHLEDGGEWILDLAAAQFGDASSVPVSAMLPLPVCNQSPTLMRRWASGTATAVFKQASSVRYNCRLKKQQAAVDHALADEMQGKLLSPHSMPPELFGIQTAGVDLVEDGVRRTFHKMSAALESELSCIQ